MSQRNGAKARFHLQRKARIGKKIRVQALRQALQEKAAQAGSTPVVKSDSN